MPRSSSLSWAVVSVSLPSDEALWADTAHGTDQYLSSLYLRRIDPAARRCVAVHCRFHCWFHRYWIPGAGIHPVHRTPVEHARGRPGLGFRAGVWRTSLLSLYEQGVDVNGK